MDRRIVIATPHQRYAALVERVRERTGAEVRWLRSREELDPSALAEIGPRYVFFPHWSWKIPPEVHQGFEAVIFHMTDLPFGRGGSPLQNLIRRGIETTQLTALRCVEALDAGPIYLKRPLSLLGTAEEIFLRAAELMEEMIVELIEQEPEPAEQQGQPVAFKRLGPKDGDLAQAQSVKQAFDMIRMLDADGYSPAFLEVGAFRLEFSRVSLKPDELVADVRIRRRDEA